MSLAEDRNEYIAIGICHISWPCWMGKQLNRRKWSCFQHSSLFFSVCAFPSTKPFTVSDTFSRSIFKKGTWKNMWRNEFATFFSNQSPGEMFVIISTQVFKKMFITRSLEIFFRSIVNGFTRRSAAIRKCGWSLLADFFLVWFRLRLPTGLGYAHTVPLSRPIEREREDSGGGKKGPSPKAGQEDLIYTPTESEKSSASNQVYAHRWARAPLPCPSNSFIFYIRSALVCLLKKKDRSCVPYVTDPILEQKKTKTNR